MALTSKSARDLADRLEPLRDDFDRIIADARTRAPLSHLDYDRLEDRVATLAADLRAVFRGGGR